MSPKSKTVPKAIAQAIQITKTNPIPLIHASVFDNLPDSAFIRESQLVQSPKRPGNPAPLPFSAKIAHFQRQSDCRSGLLLGK